MRKITTLLLLLGTILSCSNPKTEMEETPNQPSTYSFLVGTYPQSPSEGIYKITFDPSSSEIRSELLLDSIQNPSFVIANKNEEFVFAVEEIDSDQGGKVLSFEVSESGELQKISEAFTFGGAPCYLALSPDEKYLTVGNYSGGNISVYEINPKGELGLIQTVNHSGSSINKDRQEGPHVHSTVFSPDGKQLLVADLGTDEIKVYDFNSGSQEALTLSQTVKTNPGDGPRHSVFSPSGDEVAVLHEMTGELEFYQFSGGELNSIQRVSYLEDEYKGAIGGAEIRYSPDGKFLYASNRGDANTITVYQKFTNEKFVKIQSVSSGGKMPRNFILTPDGKYLLSANQASNDIIVFNRDLETGLIEETDVKIKITGPVYLFNLQNE